MKYTTLYSLAFVFAILSTSATRADDDGFQPLFAADGVPKGWTVRAWNDLAKDPGGDTAWTVTDGVLQPGKTRGTWLVSEAEYGDFILDFEIKLTEVGNSGVALRTPLKDDPAFVAMEMQVADLRYNRQAKEDELTGALYRALAPKKQVYKPTEWNHVRIELRGSRLTATINTQVIHDNIDLAALDKPTTRHDGSEAIPIKDRPVKGHIGFQHLSRNNEPILIRNAKIKVLDESVKQQ